MAIFKRNGKYWIGYTGPDGRWKRKSIGHSHAMAREAELKYKEEAAEAKHFPERYNNSRRFKEISDKFMLLHGSKLRSHVWAWLIKHINVRFGKMQIGKIRPADILSYCNQVEAETSSSTANRHLSLLRLVFNKAIAWGDFHGLNPCNGIKKKPEPNHRLRYLSPEEIRQLLAACHQRLYPVVSCALMTGMRKGEILRLDWRDIDFQSNTIQVLQTKSGKPRKIPLWNKLKQILLDLGPKTAGPVFALPEIMLRRYFVMALKDARIPEFRFHDLRHTFASYFAMKTGDLPVLQQILGHSTIQMTLRYAHLSDQHMAEKMAQMETAMPALEHPTHNTANRSFSAPDAKPMNENVLNCIAENGPVAQR